MLKILQARLQQYVNRELPDVQAGFRKGRGTRDQIANIHWIIEKARDFQKNIYFCFTDYTREDYGVAKSQTRLSDWTELNHTIALISHASKVMLKILHARLQQYMNHALLDVQTGFRKGRGSRGQIANIHWIIERARKFQKNIYLCFIDYANAFDCVDHKRLWKILKEMGISDLTCLLRHLYAGQEATVRTGHGTAD